MCRWIWLGLRNLREALKLRAGRLAGCVVAGTEALGAQL